MRDREARAGAGVPRRGDRGPRRFRRRMRHLLQDMLITFWTGYQRKVPWVIQPRRRQSTARSWALLAILATEKLHKLHLVRSSESIE